MTFTIEQLEALKEGISGSLCRYSMDFRNVRSHSVVENETGAVYAHTGYGPDGGTAYKDAELFAASPDLVDALIAEKRAHQKLRSEVEGMKSAFEDRTSPHDDYVYAQGWEYALDLVDTDLTRILEGNND